MFHPNRNHKKPMAQFENMLVDTISLVLFTTIAIGFGLLHLFLYLYHRSRSNLYFTIFAFLYAGNIFFDYLVSLTSSPSASMYLLRLHRAVMPWNPLFSLLFLYSLFAVRIPKHFWWLGAALLITGGLAVIEPIKYFDFVQFALVAVGVEVVRIIRHAIRQKKSGAWIIAAGFAALFFFSTYDVLLDLRLMAPIYDIHNGYPFGFILLIISMSIYLARDYAATNKRMLAQERATRELEIQRRLLEAENARKTQELEEARRLQLSMLPSSPEHLDGLDVCFSMRTATEVGGDYYDYQAAPDGTLTIALGDATGHGMRAGIMVAIVKSLFMNHTSDMDIPGFFQQSSQTLKQMQLGRLYMALLLVKIRDHRVVASAAGMPPLYLYRAGTGTVEEFRMRGMPLGAFEQAGYETIETSLAAGDALLLLSDGLPELFNHRDEMFDYERVKATFAAAGHESAAGIVQRLFEAAEGWAGERKADDDMTFAVIKMKQ